jgi:hypothetical protein
MHNYLKLEIILDLVLNARLLSRSGMMDKAKNPI